MASWNVEWIKAREYILLNSSSTPVRCSPSSKPNISWLMSRMEELEVPIAYTNELEELYFTRIGSDHGEYCSGKIKIASDQKTKDIMDKVLVHELAHHVDDQEDITSDDKLIEEKKTHGKYMPDRYARKNIYEYFAVGFEIYYLGTDIQKKKMKRINPRLYKLIHRVHKRFSRK